MRLLLDEPADHQDPQRPARPRPARSQKGKRARSVPRCTTSVRSGARPRGEQRFAQVGRDADDPVARVEQDPVQRRAPRIAGAARRRRGRRSVVTSGTRSSAFSSSRRAPDQPKWPWSSAGAKRARRSAAQSAAAAGWSSARLFRQTTSGAREARLVLDAVADARRCGTRRRVPAAGRARKGWCHGSQDENFPWSTLGVAAPGMGRQPSGAGRRAPL